METSRSSRSARTRSGREKAGPATAAKGAARQERAPDRSQALAIRYGPGTRRAMALALAGALTAAVLLAAYLGSVAVATQLVPMMMIMLAGFVPVPLEQLSNEQVVMYWLAPGLLMVLLLAMLLAGAVRGLWRWRTERVARINALFTPERSGPASGAGRGALRSVKDTKSLRNEDKDKP